MISLVSVLPDETDKQREDAMAAVSHCRSCGAAIYWLRHEKTGKLAPIDAAPSPNGNCLLNLKDGTYRLALGQDGTLHIHHFATCPQASQHHKQTA